MALPLELLLCKTTNTSNTSHPQTSLISSRFTRREVVLLSSVSRAASKIVKLCKTGLASSFLGSLHVRLSGIREIFPSGIRNPEKIVFMESGMLGFGIRIPALGIRNPANDWNPESLFRTRNPERIRIPQCGLQNPRLSWGYQGPVSRKSR